MSMVSSRRPARDEGEWRVVQTFNAGSELDQFDEDTPNVDKPTVAQLSCDQISRMTRAEMIWAIRASRLPVLDRRRDVHLEFYDRLTLERLVHLARRCCRNQGY